MSGPLQARLRRFLKEREELKSQYLGLKERAQNQDLGSREKLEDLFEFDELCYAYKAIKAYYDVSKSEWNAPDRQPLEDSVKMMARIQVKLEIDDMYMQHAGLHVLRKSLHENAESGGKIAHKMARLLGAEGTPGLADMMLAESKEAMTENDDVSSAHWATLGRKKVTKRRASTLGISKPNPFPSGLNGVCAIENTAQQEVVSATSKPTQSTVFEVLESNVHTSLPQETTAAEASPGVVGEMAANSLSNSSSNAQAAPELISGEIVTDKIAVVDQTEVAEEEPTTEKSTAKDPPKAVQYTDEDGTESTGLNGPTASNVAESAGTVSKSAEANTTSAIELLRTIFDLPEPTHVSKKASDHIHFSELRQLDEHVLKKPRPLPEAVPVVVPETPHSVLQTQLHSKTNQSASFLPAQNRKCSFIHEQGAITASTSPHKPFTAVLYGHIPVSTVAEYHSVLSNGTLVGSGHRNVDAATSKHTEREATGANGDANTSRVSSPTSIPKKASKVSSFAQFSTWNKEIVRCIVHAAGNNPLEPALAIQSILQNSYNIKIRIDEAEALRLHYGLTQATMDNYGYYIQTFHLVATQIKEKRARYVTVPWTEIRKQFFRQSRLLIEDWELKGWYHLFLLHRRVYGKHGEPPENYQDEVEAYRLSTQLKSFNGTNPFLARSGGVVSPTEKPSSVVVRPPKLAAAGRAVLPVVVSSPETPPASVMMATDSARKGSDKWTPELFQGLVDGNCGMPETTPNKALALVQDIRLKLHTLVTVEEVLARIKTKEFLDAVRKRLPNENEVTIGYLSTSAPQLVALNGVPSRTKDLDVTLDKMRLEAHTDAYYHARLGPDRLTEFWDYIKTKCIMSTVEYADRIPTDTIVPYFRIIRSNIINFIRVRLLREHKLKVPDTTVRVRLVRMMELDMFNESQCRLLTDIFHKG